VTLDVEGSPADAQAIMLLCSSLAAPRGRAVRPLGPRSWAKLERALSDSSIGRPAGLLGMAAADIGRLLAIEADEADRYVELLARSGQLAFELDRLQSRGMWVTTIVDARYPARLRERLGPDAPPLLFGAGDPALLGRGGIAIVGSRDADEAAIAFTERLAGAAAGSDTQIVSGAARGVDQVAMRAAFARGGHVVGALPEGVERRIRDVETRTALGDGQAVLVSPYHPAAGFSAGAAMARNKLIYATADVAVVVSSARGTGGTWEGATEAIKAGWVPVLVRDDVSVPDGNRELIQRGGWALAPDAIGESVTAADLVAAARPSARVAEEPAPYGQPSIWDRR
jgi:predicted Rossmann fold nucleotide-binding protein DprA/Smf involved in DNA uptake